MFFWGGLAMRSCLALSHRPPRYPLAARGNTIAALSPVTFFRTHATVRRQRRRCEKLTYVDTLSLNQSLTLQRKHRLNAPEEAVKWHQPLRSMTTDGAADVGKLTHAAASVVRMHRQLGSDPRSARRATGTTDRRARRPVVAPPEGTRARTLPRQDGPKARTQQAHRAQFW